MVLEPLAELPLRELPDARLRERLDQHDVLGKLPFRDLAPQIAEEVGLGADSWEPILSFYTSAGFTDERVHLFRATGLHGASAESGENERIEIVPWPLARLDEAIAGCRDSKSLIGLMWLRDELR